MSACQPRLHVPAIPGCPLGLAAAPAQRGHVAPDTAHQGPLPGEEDESLDQECKCRCLLKRRAIRVSGSWHLDGEALSVPRIVGAGPGRGCCSGQQPTRLPKMQAQLFRAKKKDYGIGFKKHIVVRYCN